MNVQARESVCHGKKLYRRSELIQHNFFKFSHSKFRHSNHRIGAQLRESHRTLRDGSFGVALSQALRARLRSVLFLRDALADLRESYRTLRDGSFEGRCPRHFVPGYDRCCSYGTRLQTCANHTVPYGTVLSGDASQALRARLRSVLSLRDIKVLRIIPTPFEALAHLRESHRTLRDGSFGVALPQALRARLRSVLSRRDAPADISQQHPTNPVRLRFGRTFCRKDKRAPFGLVATPL